MNTGNRFTTYVLKSEAYWWFYVGLTGNLKARLDRHNRGYEFATKRYAPFKLILSFEYAVREEARKMEKYLKSRVCKEYINRIYLENFGN